MSHRMLSLSIFKTINIDDVYKLLIRSYKNILYHNLQNSFISRYGFYYPNDTLISCVIDNVYVMNCDACLCEWGVSPSDEDYNADYNDYDRYDEAMTKKINRMIPNGVCLKYTSSTKKIGNEELCIACYFDHIGHYDIGQLLFFVWYFDRRSSQKSKMLS
jgi:hypothetical protein